MVFAVMSPELIALFVALTPFVVVVTTILQSWHQHRLARLKKEADDKAAADKLAAEKTIAEEKAAADKKALEETAAKLAAKTEATAEAVTTEIGAVKEMLNGNGIGRDLAEIKAELARQSAEQRRQAEWLKAHDVQDNQRHDATIAELLKIQGRKP